MAYFAQPFIDFFRQLSRNNKREWFHAHRETYEQYVKQPFHYFVDEMIHRVSAFDPAIVIEPREAIFRIARDIRFSKDKTPYKTYVAAVITRGGRKENRYPGLYFSFGIHGIAIGGGMYHPNKDDLVDIRRAIARDGKTLARALQAKQFRALFGELQGEKHKRIPKEFAAHAERFSFIANKQFYCYAEYDDLRLLLRDDLTEFVMRHYKAGSKLSEFLKAAITLPPV